MSSRSKNFNRDIRDLKSSFLSYEKDLEEIIKKLFVDSKPYNDEIKKLLVITKQDCLDNKYKYNEIINQISLADLKKQGYLVFNPKISFGEHEDIKNYLVFSFDNFAPNAENSYYRDCTIMIDILCHNDNQDLGNYRTRSMKLAGYIDGILNNSRLSGLGKLQFVSGTQIVINENFSGFCLVYSAIHGADDLIND